MQSQEWIHTIVENIKEPIHQIRDFRRDKTRFWKRLANVPDHTPIWWLFIRMIWKHGVMVFLILFPVLLLWILAQGQDLRLNLFEPSLTKTSFSDFVRIWWFLLMLVLLSYAIWVIPHFYISHEERQKANRSPGIPLVLSVSSDFIRYLAVIPFILYGITFVSQMILSERLSSDTTLSFWLINLAIFTAILIFSFKSRLTGQNFPVILVPVAILLLLLLIPALFFMTLKPDDPTISYAILGNGLLTLAFFVYVLFRKLEHLKRKGRILTSANTVYYSILAMVLVKIILLINLENTLSMATIPVIIFFNAAYILYFNLITYHFKKAKSKGKIIYLSIFLAVMVSMHLRPSSAHYVNYTLSHAHDSTISYADYEKAWIEQKIPEQDSAFIIYLIAGEGGGSRAGFWTTRIWGKLDSLSNYQFSERLFAISGVSGSSAGASAYYKWLHYRVNHPEDVDRLDRIAPQFSTRVFGNNFVTGSVIRILTTDLFKSILPFRISRQGRNVRLQKEENYGFLLSLGDSSVSSPAVIKGMELLDTLPFKKSKTEMSTVSNVHFTAFPDLYLQNQIIKTDLPLLLFNSAQIQTGKKGIASPVVLDSTQFFDAIDINHGFREYSLKNSEENRSLPLSAANNLSELFPVFSAYTYVDGMGNYIDGGIYENKGIGTIMEVYHHLRSSLDSLNRGEVRIHILSIENGNLPDVKKDTRPALQMWALFQNLYARPFRAHTDAAKKAAQSYFQQAETRDTMICISLSDYAEEAAQRVPLARDLSGRSIRQMEQGADKALRDAAMILKSDAIFKK